MNKLTKAYIIGIHLVLIAILAVSDFVPKVGKRLGVYKSPEITEHYKRMMIYHRRMDSLTPVGATLFIGDSITQGLNTSAVSDRTVNFGIGSDTTLGVLKRLPDYKHSIENADSILFAIGINDLFVRGNDEVLNNYRRILEQVPGKMVFISSILPVDERVDEFKRREINSRVNEMNSALDKLSQEFNNVTFIDVHGSVIDSTGNLNKSYHVGDGIHLNGEGYSIWIEKLAKYL